VKDSNADPIDKRDFSRFGSRASRWRCLDDRVRCRQDHGLAL